MRRIAMVLALIALCGSGCAFTMTLERPRLADAPAEKRQLEAMQQNLRKFAAEIQQAPDDKTVNAILAKYGIRNGKKE